MSVRRVQKRRRRRDLDLIDLHARPKREAEMKARLDAWFQKEMPCIVARAAVRTLDQILLRHPFLGPIILQHRATRGAVA